jgi:hypothetical protein
MARIACMFLEMPKRKLFAEGRPHVIPDSRIDHPVAEQDQRFLSAATFLVIQARPIDLHERSRRSCGAGGLPGQKTALKDRYKQ